MNKKRIRLLSTNTGLKSTSLKLLAQGLSAKLGYKVWRSVTPKPLQNNVFYGSGVDKLTQYQWFVDNNVPALEYTTDIAVVKEWIGVGDTVFGRKYLNSSCGKGIVVMDKEFTEPCPVYTRYKKKKREFRVHVFQDKVVAITEKRRRAGHDGERDTKIRNLANGYVFCQTVENIPDGLADLAVKAAQVSKSLFRGVDIGYNEKKGLFVIEVNSAPGIQGTNLNKYIEAITA